MSQISLTASMRSNLLSLQSTADLMSQTQERLATGKKVNSAIDNPSSYYTAQSLNNRANDLSSLLDSMGQAVSTIKAANEGIESITSFVEQAKAVAQSALDTVDVKSRSKYADQFNSLMEQIDSMANDSGYKGINLLKSESLTVKFSENGSSLNIEGVDATYTGLGLEKIEEGDWGGKANTDVSSPAKSGSDTSMTLEAGMAVGSIIKAGSDYYITTAATEAGTLAANVTAGNAHQLTKDGNLYYDVVQTHTASETFTSVAKGSLIKAGDDYFVALQATTAGKTADWLLDNGEIRQLSKVDGVLYDVAAGTTDINTAIEKATTAINTLRTHASGFGNNYSIVQTREEFTNNLINVLEEGADKLTLADMNEESANMLALQTRQQLAINSLSLASQAAQSVLKLFS